MTDPQMYADTQHYAALSKRELDRLRQDLGEAQTAAKREKDWTERTRAEQNVKALERQLHAAETTARQEQVGAASFDSRYIRTENIRSDGVECAPTVPYFEPPGAAPKTKAPKAAAKPIVSNISQSSVAWPEGFSERTALVQAATAELKRVAA